jgi:hypothetical protein
MRRPLPIKGEAIRNAFGEENRFAEIFRLQQPPLKMTDEDTER